MPRHIDLKQKAKHCRELLRMTTVTEVREQLEIWAREFEERANTDDFKPMFPRQMLTNSAS